MIFDRFTLLFAFTTTDEYKQQQQQLFTAANCFLHIIFD